MSWCTKRRRSVVHRCPAVPTAANTIARRARSTSAVGHTIAALLPPSSRIVRLNDVAHAAPTARPIAVEPVALTRRMSGCATSASPSARSPTASCAMSRNPGSHSRSTRCRIACATHADSGVFSDGFHTTALPHASASAAFHAHTATGKLKAEITPHTPNGCQVSSMRCSGRSEAIVRPCSCRESPTAKSQMSIISCTSPRPSCASLPASSVTIRPSGSLASRKALPKRRTSSPRRGAGTSRQRRCAAAARATPAAKSSAVVGGTCARVLPSIGVRERIPSVASGVESMSSAARAAVTALCMGAPQVPGGVATAGAARGVPSGSATLHSVKMRLPHASQMRRSSAA